LPEHFGYEFMKHSAFFRVYWERARVALSNLLLTEDVDTDNPPSTAQFVRWLPHGIDADSWADQHSGLEVQAVKVSLPSTS